MERSPVVHFELPYQDRQRASDFYQQVFGWQPQLMGPEMGEYVVVTTTEMDERSGFPAEPGRINGGLFPKSETNQQPTVVIAVNDIRAAMKAVEEGGGKLTGGSTVGEPDMVPGIGQYIAFTDTEGNRIAMLQPEPMQPRS